MLTKQTLALLVTAPLVAGATSHAVAQGDTHGRRDLIQTFDQNGDGSLNTAERAHMKAAFEAKRAERHKEMLATYDTNQDGKLDPAERKAMRDARLAESFQAMDQNGDGKLTLEEFKAGAGSKGNRHGRHGHGRTHGASMKR